MKTIVLRIPAIQFNKDFLDCEVEKKLGVRGDALFYHIKKEYIKELKKETILFSNSVMYMCNRVGNDVILIGA